MANVKVHLPMGKHITGLGRNLSKEVNVRTLLQPVVTADALTYHVLTGAM